jgi:hypothetical protein
MSIRTPRRYLDAIHEAGHVVYALAKSIRFEYVTVAHGEHDGVSTRGYVRIVTQRMWLYDQIGMFWAGMVAEKIHRPRRMTWDAHVARNWEGDIRAIVESIEETNKWRRVSIYMLIESTLKSHAPRARKILKRRWADVLAVADALMLRETLTRGEVLDVIRATGRIG